MPSALYPLRVVETKRGRHASGGAERAEHRGGVKSSLVHALGRDQTQAAHHFAAHREPARHVAARDVVLLGGGKQGRNDDRAGVHRTAFEGVVVVLAVRGGAVAQRRGGDVVAAGVADHGARAGLGDGAQRRLHVVAMARRHAQPGDVGEHRVAHGAQFDGKLCRRRGERRSEALRDGNFRKRHRADATLLRSCLRARRPSSARSRRPCTCRIASASSASR